MYQCVIWNSVNLSDIKTEVTRLKLLISKRERNIKIVLVAPTMNLILPRDHFTMTLDVWFS